MSPAAASLPAPSASPRPLAFALGTSLALHAVLALALIAIIAENPAPRRALDAPLTARLESVPTPAPPLPPAVEPASQPVPTHTPTENVKRPAPRAVPLPRQKPAPPPAVREFVTVTHNVDAAAALGDAFAPLVATELAGLQRVPLEFETAPVISVPAEAMRGAAQWRIRTLLRISDAGSVELVRAADYEPRLVLAISNALDRSRAKPADGAATIEPGYAIVDFWFDLGAGEATK